MSRPQWFPVTLVALCALVALPATAHALALDQRAAALKALVAAQQTTIDALQVRIATLERDFGRVGLGACREKAAYLARVRTP